MHKKRTAIADAGQDFNLDRAILIKCCKAIDTPRSLAVAMLADANEWDQYLSLTRPDTETHAFADDYLVTSMLSKHPKLPGTQYDKRQSAVTGWFEAEECCRIQNEKARRCVSDPSFDPIYVSARERIRVVIESILGPLTRSDLSFAESHMRFGPGATSAVSGLNVVLSRKMTSKWDVTQGLLPYFRSLIPFVEGFRSPSGDLVSGNKVVFVPKNSKTDRAIAVEPHTNMYVQLGCGALLRQRLRKYGLDIRNQKAKNRKAVMLCEQQRRVTIDLKSASDMISYHTVLDLIPFEWFHLLDISRCENSSIDGTLVPLEKFSSMGNGYTFELETLIFYAACAACGDWGAEVFGDDIICDADKADDIIAILTAIGCKVNSEKTLLAGVFFESCGVDVHRGSNVRPFYLKGKNENKVLQCIRNANAIRFYAHRRLNYFDCDGRFLNAWLECVKRSKIASRTFSSYPYDNAIWRNFDEATPTLDKRGWAGFVCRVYRGRSIQSVRTVPIGSYLGSLAFGSHDVSRNTEYSRLPQRNFALSTSFLFGEWYNLGRWI